MLATETRGQLIGERVRLERRLHKGWDEIGRAEAEGRVQEADHYFKVWEAVLKDYERVCDAIRARERRA